MKSHEKPSKPETFMDILSRLVHSKPSRGHGEEDSEGTGAGADVGETKNQCSSVGMSHDLCCEMVWLSTPWFGYDPYRSNFTYHVHDS